MIYRFIDDQGSFVVPRDPQGFNLYFPLTDAAGSILSSIGPNLAGDIKKDNERFLTVPAGIEDIRNNLLCRREFFVRAGRRLFRLSLPRAGDSAEYGLLYQKLYKRLPGISVEILTFVPCDIPVELTRVRLTNTSKKKIRVVPTSFLPLFGRSEKNLRDHRHVSSLLNRVFLSSRGIVLKPTMIFDEKGHKVNKTNYFVFGYEGRMLGSGSRRPIRFGRVKAPAGQFPTLDSFLGRSDILSPEAVEKDAVPFTRHRPEFDGKEACAAFRFSPAELLPGESREYITLAGISEDAKEPERLFGKLDRPEKVEQAFERTKKYWAGYGKSLEFDFKDRDFNNWLRWVKLQPVLRKLFGCSFLPHFDYGKGGRGWRDLWQDALGLLLTEPDKSRQLIEGSFRGVRIDGSNATIITKEGDFIADRNRINRVWMDHGVWPYLTARAYVHRTGDLGFLLKQATYFRDHQLKRAQETDSLFRGKDFLLKDSSGSVYRGSILEHILIQTLVQFFNVGNHNIIRLENADWNDGMDMAPDKGESCVFSYMYAHNIRDLIVLLEALKRSRKSLSLMEELLPLFDRIRGEKVDYSDWRKKRARLARYFEKTRAISGKKTEVRIDDIIADLTAKWRHSFAWLSRGEWLKEGFFNGYYDNNGRRVEGSRGGAVRMTLPAQVFAVMSGVADEKQVSRVWRAAKKNLRDRELKGFRLNTDFGGVQMDLGRAFGFSYGDKENGGFFSHMSVMFANALLKRGFVAEGREVFDSIYSMSLSDKAEIPPGIPEYFNSQGKGMYLYLTGSASWYVYTLTEQLLGIEFLLGDLRISPRLTGDCFSRGPIQASFSFKGKTVSIRYTVSRPRRGVLAVKKVTLNGRDIARGSRGFLISPSLFAKAKNTVSVSLV